MYIQMYFDFIIISTFSINYTSLYIKISTYFVDKLHILSEFENENGGGEWEKYT